MISYLYNICILLPGMTWPYAFDQSMINISDMTKMLEGEGKPNPKDST